MQRNDTFPNVPPPRCPYTRVTIPECGCRACNADQLAARRGVIAIDRGEYVTRDTVARDAEQTYTHITY